MTDNSSSVVIYTMKKMLVGIAVVTAAYWIVAVSSSVYTAVLCNNNLYIFRYKGKVCMCLEYIICCSSKILITYNICLLLYGKYNY